MRRSAPILTATFVGIVAAIAAGAAEWPTLPAALEEDTLIGNRLVILCPRIAYEREKISEVKDQNDWPDVLLWNRIKGGYSVGEGLTVQSQTSSGVVTDILDEKRFDSWAVSYEIPLSIFRKKRSIDVMADRDMDVLLAKQDIEVLAEAGTIRTGIAQYNSTRDLFNVHRCSSLEAPNSTCQALFVSAWKQYRTLEARAFGYEALCKYCPDDVLSALSELVKVSNEPCEQEAKGGGP